jgi:hypothetical protein
VVKKVPDCFLGAGKRTQYTGLCDPHYLNLSSDYFCSMYTVQTMHKQKQLLCVLIAVLVKYEYWLVRSLQK